MKTLNKKKETLGVGILGAGGIAILNHLPAISRTKGMKVMHVAGRKAERLRALQEQFDVPHASQNWEAVLQDDSVDAVIVSLPHPLHAEAGLAVLRAGKHLMMQKPLCATMEEADALVAEAHSRPNQVVYCLPACPPAVQTMVELSRSGAIGKISGVASRHSHGGPEVYYAEVADAFGEPRKKEDLWFYDSAKASVGALFDMGVYAVANLVYLAGRAVSVTARLTTVDKPTTLEDTASLIVEFQGGALGVAETSWCDPARTSFNRIHGTHGKLWSPGSEGHPLDLWTPSRSDRENAPPVLAHPTVEKRPNAHEDWLQCIRQGRQPEWATVDNARHITAILIAALQSSREKRTIEIP